MKKFYSFSLRTLFLLIGLNALHAQYGDGVLISNEGNFGGYNASVSYIDRETQLLTNDIYNTVNNEDIGDILQNIGVHGDKAYLVVNNSNKVIVVDRETFEKQAVITEGIAQPRYITFANDKYYVTNSDSESQSVTVYDIETNELINEIVIGSTVEKIKAVGNHVFVQDVWFGSGSTVSVIDATTDELIDTLELEQGVTGLDVDENFAYIISGNQDYSHIYKVDGETLEIVADARSTEVVNGGQITLSDDTIFFTANINNIYAYSANDLSGEPVHVLTVTENSWSTLYGFGVINGFLFSSDANGFVAPSIVTVYDVASGNELINLNTGMGANGFYASFDGLGTTDVIANALDIAVYPNPVVDYIQFNGVDNAKVQVYDVNGKLVRTFDYDGVAVNVGELKSGLYFFVISTQTSKTTKKVLVK